MKPLELQYADLCRLHATFGRVIYKYTQEFSAGIQDEDLHDMSVASLAKHFDLTYRLLWKYIQLYFKQKYGVRYRFSRIVFQECLRRRITSAEETEQLLSMISCRKMSAELYIDEYAQKVVVHIPQYHRLVGTILPRITPTTTTEP